MVRSSGVGTGISAGAALLLPVERVVVCEILGEVVELAREHFRPWVNGLFDDPRVVIHAEDGRHCLARSPERFDATMASVFPELTLWRGDLYPSRSIVAFVGRNEDEPLDPEVLVRNARLILGSPERAEPYYEALGLRFYAGNPGVSRFFADARINTDDRPLIEYLVAPRTHRAVLTGAAQWVIGAERDRLYAKLFDVLPPERDPYLDRLNEAQRLHVAAGLRYALYQGARARGTPAESRAAWQDFLEVATPFTRNPDSPAGQAGFGATGFGAGEGN